MKLPWSRKREPDPVAEEIVEQIALSRATLGRVDRVLQSASEHIGHLDDARIEGYTQAERERTQR